MTFRAPAAEKLAELRRATGRIIQEGTNRKAMTPKRKREAFAACEGICARCDEAITGKFEVDHIIALGLNGEEVLGNLVPLHPWCHKPKTKSDKGKIAKAKRIARREAEGPKPSAFKPGPRLQGRGFRTDITRNMRGEIVRRKAVAQ